jgi:hypothetical protein
MAHHDGLGFEPVPCLVRRQRLDLAVRRQPHDLAKPRHDRRRARDKNPKGFAIRRHHSTTLAGLGPAIYGTLAGDERVYLPRDGSCAAGPSPAKAIFYAGENDGGDSIAA